MTQVPCELCDGHREFIGEDGKDVNIFAMRGGALLDSVFQLGVAHAHIVSDTPSPALLVGTSVGAVHATAVAEILQADQQVKAITPADQRRRRETRLNRFREILYAYQDFATSVSGALPDAHEADAGKPLQPNPQAIHFETEREARQEALRSRTGVIALMNDVFSQTVSARTLARFTRVVLGWKALDEAPPSVHRRRWFRELFFTLKTILAEPLAIPRFASTLLRAWTGGSARLTVEEFSKSKAIGARLLCWFARKFEGRYTTGYTAGEVIFSGKRRSSFALALMATGVVILYALILALIAWCTARWPVPTRISCALSIVYFLYRVWPLLKTVRMRLRSLGFWSVVLTYYDLRRDLGNDYVIRDLFIRLFNPDYHGTIEMADVTRRAMADDETGAAPQPDHEKRTFQSFLAHQPPIRVVPLVANLANGAMEEVPLNAPIVDGLSAAVAAVPFLAPKNQYVDAGKIGNDAGLGALGVLRAHLHPGVSRAHLFLVDPLTLREPKEKDTVSGTVEVALYGLELARFRDAEMERELLTQYQRMIPEQPTEPERFTDRPRALRCFGQGQHYVRPEVRMIQPSVALHTTGAFLQAKTKNDRQRALAIAVAEGCRSTLAALYGEHEITAKGCRALASDDPEGKIAPGAAEVCKHCSLHADVPERYKPPEAARPAATTVTTAKTPAPDQPQIAVLFSGGVFRGVFQIGVLNALHQLGVKPSIIAGSSVGSIVAVMTSRVFSLDAGSYSDAHTARDVEVARLAATFLTLDRLIITDRFADFIRRFTLRAAAARFSLRDADRFFRNYDAGSSDFERVARRVVGGIEHLFYIDPFELAELVRSIRLRDSRESWRLLTQYVQELCDRGLVGFELLGAEPLALLIKEHVLEASQRYRHAHAIALDQLQKDLTFLVTATNLTRREPVVIGGAAADAMREAVLIEALLASSAFPGVFRPRWSREVFFDDNSLDQFMDGGILDNLPISAVVAHMRAAAKGGLIQPRPGRNTPHLIIAASLEPETPNLEHDPDEIERIGDSWLRSRKYAKRLGYNKKFERFADVQQQMRDLFNRYAEAGSFAVGANELDLHPLVIKSKWLCGTFAFHPMLGFRRDNQAASIAHGCASTFAAFSRTFAQTSSLGLRWFGEWNIDTDGLGSDSTNALQPRWSSERGRCHFKPDVLCPFSRTALERAQAKDIDRSVFSEIEKIYILCGEATTHQQPPA
jgi:predicted acylesterase/phospholipase RssA